MEEEDEATATASPNDPMVAMPSSPPSNINSWAVGSRLESKARDSNGGEQWFPAKVLEVEAEGRGVLVHYMQWNARHDEWIPSNSSRLRPLPNSGKSSRHSSGGNGANNSVEVSELAPPTTTSILPPHKDFKPGEKVMATWKLNRKYLATVIKFEASDGTYLVEFYDGVQCKVKPNNMRRPRKGEDGVEQQEALRVNGAADNGSAENSDNEELNASGGPSSGRRERKRKFDVKQLLNIRSVKTSLRSNSKEEHDLEQATPATPTVVENKRSKRRPERNNSQKALDRNGSLSNAEPLINGGGGGSKTRSKTGLEDGPALAAVSGKRERRKKKFWDEEESVNSNVVAGVTSGSSSSASSGSSSNSSATLATAGGATAKAKELSSSVNSVSSASSSSSSALKRKSSSSVSNPLPKKTAKKSEKAGDVMSALVKDEQTAVRPNGSVIDPSHGNGDEPRSKDKPSGKENGKVLPYLQLDLTDDPELIAEKMIEGVNIPGMGQPIPVDSSSLPEGWEKRVIQRRIGITKGKWDVFITNPETGKSFRSKTELQKHLDERKLPYSSDAFDFSLDDNLKRLRQIWKQYKVKPFLNNPKGTGSSNFKHVPAKITQVQDSDVKGGSGNANASPAAAAMAAAASATAVNSLASAVTPSASSKSSNSTVPALAPFQPNEVDSFNLACFPEIAVESETGQGLRCSIGKCGKLFRNDRLLRQHVKHYHRKVYESLLCKHPQIGDDISEPTSPEARRLSDDVLQHQDNGLGGEPRRRIPSAEGFSRRTSNSICMDDLDKTPRGALGRSFSRKSMLDEEAPLSSIFDGENDDDYVVKRTRNDSVLSSVTSDTEELSVVGDHQHLRGSCPPTPPTFRLSKRRQAQMRKRVQQPIIRVSKIEDTPLGREYRDELLSVTSPLSTPANGPMCATGTTTSPSSINILDSSAATTGLTPSSYPPSEMDASIAGSEHLTSEELVNCTCRRIEEDGLMIQCDICLCWQHGYCVGIEDEDPVPEKHVCETCRQPPGGRTEARFSLDQDWLKEGKLPSSDAVLDNFIKKKSSSGIADRETAFRKLSELMADLVNLDKVLNSLRVKLHVASQPSNSKVFMWSSVWSLPTHQPMPVEDDHYKEDMMEEDEEDVTMDVNGASATNNANDAIVNRSAIDPHAVAEKLSLLAKSVNNDDKLDSPPNEEAAVSVDSEQPKVNGIKEPPRTSTPTMPKVADTEDEEKPTTKGDVETCANDNAFLSKNLAELTSQQESSDESKLPTTAATADASNVTSPVSRPLSPTPPTEPENDVVDQQPNTDESVKTDDQTKKEDNKPCVNEDETPSVTPKKQGCGHNGTAAVEEEHFDTSFLPSVSEVERLLPSVIQEFGNSASTTAASLPTTAPPVNVATTHNNTISTSASTSSSTAVSNAASADVIIPEPKRLDRDECRLNLLQHIESVQLEVEKRYKAIEDAVTKIEAMPGASNAGISLAQINESDARLKGKLNKLIQDLTISRQLNWTL